MPATGRANAYPDFQFDGVALFARASFVLAARVLRVAVLVHAVIACLLGVRAPPAFSVCVLRPSRAFLQLLLWLMLSLLLYVRRADHAFFLWLLAVLASRPWLLALDSSCVLNVFFACLRLALFVRSSCVLCVLSSSAFCVCA